MEKIVIHQQYAGFEDLFNKFGARDDIPDLGDDDAPSVADQVWQAGPIQAALKSANGASIVLDLPLPPSDDVDSEENSPFYKLPVIVKTAPAGSSTLGKRARPAIAKTTIRVDDDGFEWSESFDASGQLIDTRVLLSRQ